MSLKDKIISDAIAKSLEHGEKFTRPRQMVLEKIIDASKPVKAYDIVGIIDENGKTVKPPTVYRALEFLVKIGIIHKIESDNSFIICDHGNHCHSHSHIPLLLICKSCGKVYEDHILDLETKINENAQRLGFKINKTIIEAHGICDKCSV